MKRSIVWFAAVILLTACSTGKGPVQTAIAQTQSAGGTSTAVMQQQTHTAVAGVQMTQSAQNIALQGTLAAVAQTQSALSAQQQIQAAIAMTQAAAPTPTEEGTMLDAEGTPIPGVNTKSSTGVDFSDARIYSKSSLGNRKYMITIQLKDSVKEIPGNYFLEVSAKKFKCSTIKDYPNRLYCTGDSPRGGYHSVRLYEDINGLARMVFVTDITLPIWTPTFIHGGKPSPTANASD